jgi:hypothetical protein
MFATSILLGPSARAQAPSAHNRNGMLHIVAPAFHFITGTTLDQLRDGRSVQIDLEMSALPGPGGSPAHRSRARVTLSYDLWEERFAAATAGPPTRAARHLSAADAEGWCLDQLATPVSALGRLAQDPMWIRLTYRVDPDSPASAGDTNGFTLRGLIDRMSRRPAAGEIGATMEIGPFQLSR